MYKILNLNFNKNAFFSILLAIMPFSFIAGNMLINLNILALIVLALIVFKIKIFDIKYYIFDKILILFFLFILFTGIVNDYHFYVNKLEWKEYFSTVKKSIFFFRYLLFYFCLRYLIERKIIDLKFFFISTSIASIFVCLDIFFQFIYGEDIFGYEAYGSGRKLSGPFGNELIAGGFIQRFCFFSFFLLPIFFKNINNKVLILIITVLFVIYLSGIILSGNRMPFILFFFMLTLFLILQKNVRKYFLVFVSASIIILFLSIKTSEKVASNFNKLFIQINYISKSLINSEFNDIERASYLVEFATFYDTWLMNKYIGGGIKNFRYYCHIRPNIEKNSIFYSYWDQRFQGGEYGKKIIFKCNMHPHNYYLEIMTETGVIGLILITMIFSSILYIVFFKNYISQIKKTKNLIYVPFLYLFLAEIFPIKASGSFFTTGNSTYLFLIMAILVGLVSNDKSIEKKN